MTPAPSSTVPSKAGPPQNGQPENGSQLAEVASSGTRAPLWRRTWQGAREFLRDEDGPTAVEYAVMLAFIVGVCIASVNQLATHLDDNVNRSSVAIDAAIN